MHQNGKDKIRIYMKQTDRTQAEMAIKFGVGVATLSRYLNNGAGPLEIEIIDRIVAVVPGMTRDDILGPVRGKK